MKDSAGTGASYGKYIDQEPDLMKKDSDDNRYVYSQEPPNNKCIACCYAYPKTTKCSWICIGIFLFILTIQGLIVPHLITMTVRNGIVDALVFEEPKPNDDNYQQWLQNINGSGKVPMWMECRFFNVTNVEELLSSEGNGFPQLEITPPLIYNEWYIKYDVNFTNQSEYVEYYQWTYYTEKMESMYENQLHPDDYVVIVSPLVGALWYNYEWNTGIVKKWEWKEISELINYIDPQILFWKGTAKQILFDIYHFNITLAGREIFELDVPFGLLNNGTSPWNQKDSLSPWNSTYEVTHTGKGAHHRMGEVQFYGAQNRGWLDCWNPAMQIAPGHDTYFGIGSCKKNDQQMLFVSTIYKNVVLNYNYSYTWKHNIELFRYTVEMIPQYVNASLWPPNSQYFQMGTSGLQNITNCSGGVPIFVSFPLFLGGDDFYKNVTKMGLPLPDWDMLPTVDVQPKTGGIFKANKTLQLNTIIHSLPFDPLFNRSNRSNITDEEWKTAKYELFEDDPESLWNANYSLENIADGLFVPMVELSECGEITDKQASSFSTQVIFTKQLVKALEITSMVSVALLVVWGTLCGVFIGKRNGSKQYVLQ